MGNQPEQVLAVHGGIAEALSRQETVRVQATAADLHHRAGLAQRRERFRANLPGHCRRMVKGVVEAVRHDVQAGVGGARVG
jgi:hypothetical protein